MINQLEFPASLSLRRPWALIRSSLDDLLDVASVRGLGLFRLDRRPDSVAMAEISEPSNSFLEGTETEMEVPHGVPIVRDGLEALSPAGILERTSLGGMIRESQASNRRRRQTRRSPVASLRVERRRSKRGKPSASLDGPEMGEGEVVPLLAGSSSIESSSQMADSADDSLVEVNPLAHRLAAWDEEPEAIKRVAVIGPAEDELSSALVTAPVARIRLSTRPRLTKNRYDGGPLQEDTGSEVTRQEALVPASFPEPFWVLQFSPDRNQVYGLLR